MVFVYFYFFYDDLDSQQNTSRGILDQISAFVENDQNPEDSGFNDFDTTFEDLLNSSEFEEFFTETEEKLEEESVEILNDRSGFLSEKYDFKELTFFLFWGSISNKLKNDDYKSMLSYYNPFIKINDLDFISKKKNLSNYFWCKDQNIILNENFLNFPAIYLINNSILDLFEWSYGSLYLNFKGRLNCNLPPLDYFESTFYFLPDPEIQENFLDFDLKNKLYFIFAQDGVKLPDWDDREHFLIEPDLNDVFDINIRAHFIIFDDKYSISLHLSKTFCFRQVYKPIFFEVKGFFKEPKKNSLLVSLEKCLISQ